MTIESPGWIVQWQNSCFGLILIDCKRSWVRNCVPQTSCLIINNCAQVQIPVQPFFFGSALQIQYMNMNFRSLHEIIPFIVLNGK